MRSSRSRHSPIINATDLKRIDRKAHNHRQSGIAAVVSAWSATRKDRLFGHIGNGKKLSCLTAVNPVHLWSRERPVRVKEYTLP